MDMYRRIENLLSDKNISLLTMCRSLSISYSSYITKRSLFLDLEPTEVIRIANFLHVDAEYLYLGKEDNNEDHTLLLPKISFRKMKIIEKITFLDEYNEAFDALEERVDYLYRKTLFANDATVA